MRANIRAKPSAAWRRDQAHMTAAYDEFDTLTSTEQIKWVLRFARTNPRDLHTLDPVVIGYQLRGLARVVGLGWEWKRRVGPLSGPSLMQIHRALNTGLTALNSSRAASPSGRTHRWRLPAHRTSLSRLPPPPDNPDTRMPIVETYDAKTEVAGIIAAIGHFLQRHSPRWRVCPCGCGESFVVRGKQKYFDKAHENRARQRRWAATNRKKGTKA